MGIDIMGEYKILSTIKSPDDVKQLDEKSVDLLCEEIREKLVEVVSVNGGHLSPNLGVVELTVAMHRVFNFPKDSLVWDVGHQSYTHKLLTGRFDRFDTLRTKGGISGFPKKEESIYDDFNTGHSSTSISAAFGIANAKAMRGDNSHTVAVIGDGSLTGGLAFEAMNNAGRFNKNFIVVLNDNKMSISKNVGAIPRYLTTVRIQPRYIRIKRGTERVLSKIPFLGRVMKAILRRSKSRIKNLVYKNTLFDCFGFTYLGPIDGHNVEELENAFLAAKKNNTPALIHVVTKKGKGYQPAESKPGEFHGIGQFDIDSGEPMSSHWGFSAEFGKMLCSLAEKDDKICAITAAMTSGTGLTEFSKDHKNRFFDVGIAEEHAVVFAAGLARAGYKPFVAIYSSFLQRAFDYIIEDVALQGLHVVFCIDRSGLVGADGETHHGSFDLSYMSMIPGMTILAPADGNQLEEMVQFANEMDGPVAIRYPRGSSQADHLRLARFKGSNTVISSGKDVTILAVGAMLDEALKAADILKEKGISAGVTNIAVVKPVDTSLGDLDTKLVVTLEDNVLSGGFGEAFTAMYRAADFDILSVGLPDSFVEHGDIPSLRKECGIDAQSVAEKIMERLDK